LLKFNCWQLTNLSLRQQNWFFYKSKSFLFILFSSRLLLFWKKNVWFENIWILLNFSASLGHRRRYCFHPKYKLNCFILKAQRLYIRDCIRKHRDALICFCTLNENSILRAVGWWVTKIWFLSIGLNINLIFTNIGWL
jgi:hypothetical protein